MREYLVDLHIHSRFSRATSTKLDIPLLAAWAKLKGLSLLGTGDITHPKWRAELHEQLRYDDNSGLYTLAETGLAAKALPELPVDLLGGEGSSPVNFILQGEISSIYKRGGKVRKVHNLVFLPDLESAEKLAKNLSEIGNLHSDGRPILGLDSRDLLEIVLETDSRAFLVPAHIWTPWFSLFGSKSGFDSLQDCFGDLSPEIFALETGLSSDPAMNRLWSALDGYRLISNSDAHSGENLGREANIFCGELSYDGILKALKQPATSERTIFAGTLEFFPEEGKYHMDGHRNCKVCLRPEDSRKTADNCPVCGAPLTIGVLNRVQKLADRNSPDYSRSYPKNSANSDFPASNPVACTSACSQAVHLPDSAFASLVPLPEVLSELLGVGPKSRKVGDMYSRLLERFGPELAILRQVETTDLARFFPPLGEALLRMRKGDVLLSGGYDGEYGKVRMFSDKERESILRGAGFSAKTRRNSPAVTGLSLPGHEAKPQKRKRKEPDLLSKEDFIFSDAPTADTQPDNYDNVAIATGSANFPANALQDKGRSESIAQQNKNSQPAHSGNAEDTDNDPYDFIEADSDRFSGPDILNPSQERAMVAGPGPVLVLAGPGTGKTKTLIARISHLLDSGVSPRKILAVTFTRRAATELDKRLRETLDEKAELPRSDTLHAVALELWHKVHGEVPILLSEENARQVFAEANNEAERDYCRDAFNSLNLSRERLEHPEPDELEMNLLYLQQKGSWNLADYTDLLEFWLEQISGNLYKNPYEHVLVDEVQDLSPLQLALVRSLAPSGKGFFGIGDPDQSIYSFRGAHGDCLSFFSREWADLQTVSLTHNYRSRAEIIRAAEIVLADKSNTPALLADRPEKGLIALFQAPTAETEAQWIAGRIHSLLGGSSHSLQDAAVETAFSPFSQSNVQSKTLPLQPEKAKSVRGTPLLHAPGDIAILVRTNALGSLIRNSLQRQGVPVSEPAKDSFWADERVKLILRAASRMYGISVCEEEGFGDAPACPDHILTKGPNSVAAYFSTFPPFDAMFWQSAAFRSLLKAYNFSGGWAELLTFINLQNELELVRSKGQNVQILSMHAAKGLEFSTVFLPCLEDGLMPFAGPAFLSGKPNGKKSQGSEDEERRLFYAGLTRARNVLYLSYAAKRSLYGKELRLQPSRFLKTLPPDLLHRSTLVAKTTRKEKQLSLL